MKPATAQLFFIIVILSCGYVVSNAPAGVTKTAAFIIGILAAGLAIYLHWSKR